PSVVGVPYEQAASQLQGASFAVARRFVDSNEPKGTVVGMDPGANTLQPRGSTITLSVSKGPTTQAVPDVTSFDRSSAVATLRNSGFGVVTVKVDTTDPTQGGVVLDQTPAGGKQAKPHTIVTIRVGHYVAPPPPPPPPPTPPPPPPPPT